MGSRVDIKVTLKDYWTKHHSAERAINIKFAELKYRGLKQIRDLLTARNISERNLNAHNV
jgi:hypothetical protein